MKIVLRIQGSFSFSLELQPYYRKNVGNLTPKCWKGFAFELQQNDNNKKISYVNHAEGASNKNDQGANNS